MGYFEDNDIFDLIDEDTLIQLTDDDNVGLVDWEKVAQVRKASDALINGYCGKVYKVPFSPVPELAKDFSLIISIYKLYGRRQGAPEDIKTRFDDTVDYLKGVAKGENSMGIQPDPDPPDDGDYSGSIRVDTGDKMFGSDTMSKF